MVREERVLVNVKNTLITYEIWDVGLFSMHNAGNNILKFKVNSECIVLPRADWGVTDGSCFCDGVTKVLLDVSLGAANGGSQ